MLCSAEVMWWWDPLSETVAASSMRLVPAPRQAPSSVLMLSRVRSPKGFSVDAPRTLMSVGGVIELARTLGRLPPRLTIYAIEGRNFEIGAQVTPEVLAAAREVERSLRRETGHDDTEAPGLRPSK